MENKRSSAKGAAIGWAFGIGVVLVLGWWFFLRTPRREQTAQPKPPATNLVDRARATNLLHWLNTNAIPPTNLATKPVTPPPTNRAVTNRFPIARTNLLTVRTAAPPIFRASTNLVAVAP